MSLLHPKAKVSTTQGITGTISTKKKPFQFIRRGLHGLTRIYILFYTQTIIIYAKSAPIFIISQNCLSVVYPKNTTIQNNIYIKLLTRNHSTGTSNAGSKFSVLQSFSLSKESPEATIISPPTMSNSAMSASLTAVLDSFATK